MSAFPFVSCLISLNLLNEIRYEEWRMVANNRQIRRAKSFSELLPLFFNGKSMPEPERLMCLLGRNKLSVASWPGFYFSARILYFHDIRLLRFCISFLEIIRPDKEKPFYSVVFAGQIFAISNSFRLRLNWNANRLCNICHCAISSLHFRWRMHR